MNQTKEVARVVSSVGGRAICAVAALISVAVLLAFVSRRAELLDSSLAPRELVLGGIALLLLAVFVLILETRRDRRTKGAVAVLAVVCAAAGAVLVWVAYDEGQSGAGKAKPPIAHAKKHPRGKLWKLQHGHAPKGKSGGGKTEVVKDTSSAGAASAGGAYDEEAEAGYSTTPESDCYCKGEYTYDSSAGGGGGGGGYYSSESGGGSYEYEESESEYEYEEPEDEYEEPEEEFDFGPEYEEEGEF